MTEAPGFDVATGSLPHFARPYGWNAIDRAVRTSGGAIVESLLPADEIEPLNTQVDDYLKTQLESAAPDSGSALYDVFLGHKTLRLHGLIEKMPMTANLIGRPELVDWAERLIGSTATSVLLNAGELIQIQPGEPAQFLHRDSDSWVHVPIREDPMIVNAIIALDPFTLKNGATYLTPDSWRWDPSRQPQASEFARAVMNRGDALLFRGDLIHGGGENESDAQRRAISISYCAGWLHPVENKPQQYANCLRDCRASSGTRHTMQRTSAAASSDSTRTATPHAHSTGDDLRGLAQHTMLSVVGTSEARVWVSAVKAMVPERVRGAVRDAARHTAACESAGLAGWRMLRR